MFAKKQNRKVIKVLVKKSLNTFSFENYVKDNS